MSNSPLIPRLSRAGVHRLLGRLLAGPAAPPAADQPLGDAISPASVRGVLILKPDHLGDVLLASPALALLRERLPAATLTLAVGPWSAALAERLPMVDRVLTIPFPGFERARPRPPLWRWLLLLRLAYRWRGQFDAALVLRDDFYWGAMLAAVARIPVRLGTATPLCAPFLTAAVAPRRQAAAAQHLQVAALLTGDQPPGCWTPAQPLRVAPRPAAAPARQALAAAGLNADEPYALLHPGAGAAVKLWTPQHWGVVLRALHARRGLRTLVLAGAGEQHLLPPILRHAGTAAVPLGGGPDLDLLCALLAGATLVLGVDSGPLHLAAALDVPSVRLYGPVDPAVYGPWADPRRHRWVASALLCAPCDRLEWDRLDLPWHPCVRRLDPAAVLAAAEAALDAR